jgi:hypothetical protein
MPTDRPLGSLGLADTLAYRYPNARDTGYSKAKAKGKPKGPKVPKMPKGGKKC